MQIRATREGGRPTEQAMKKAFSYSKLLLQLRKKFIKENAFKSTH